MSERKTSGNRKTLLVLMILLTAAVVAGVLLSTLLPEGQPAEPKQTTTGAPTVMTETTPPETTEAATEPQLPIELGEELRITAIESYAGIYMEDGTDDVVQDLLMVVLENYGEQALQYARIVLDYGDAQAGFDVTNLPAGGKVVLLEKSRMAYRSDPPLDGYTENVVLMEAFPMHEDIFRITTADGVINVRNISGEDITGDIFIYYKNVGGDLYYGGITYRVRIEGGLAADEIRQLMTAHYYENASEILMVTYAQ